MLVGEESKKVVERRRTLRPRSATRSESATPGACQPDCLDESTTSTGCPFTSGRPCTIETVSKWYCEMNGFPVHVKVVNGAIAERLRTRNVSTVAKKTWSGTISQGSIASTGDLSKIGSGTMGKVASQTLLNAEQTRPKALVPTTDSKRTESP